MDRGYLKLWRKTQDSDIWLKPPLYFKVWIWILSNADYKTGELTCTYDYIAERVYWEDNNKEIIPHRNEIGRIIKWLEENKMVKITKCGAGSRKFTRISVVNYGTYNTSKDELEAEMRQQTVQQAVHSLRSNKNNPTKPIPHSGGKSNEEIIAAANKILDAFDTAFPASVLSARRPREKQLTQDLASILSLLTEHEKTPEDLMGYIDYFINKPNKLAFWPRPVSWSTLSNGGNGVYVYSLLENDGATTDSAPSDATDAIIDNITKRGQQ